MSTNAEVVDLELFIRKSPSSVRSWWIDLPDDYQAKDPREQPFRIVTTKRTTDGRELVTYWRNPDGSTREVNEVLHSQPDGNWIFDIDNHPLGFRIHDEFRLEPAEGGTKLHIRSTITPKDASASSRIPMMKQRFTEVWKMTAEICERDAP